ncbi:MAG: ACT domain-containing protein [Acidimicrobiales bacterium]
MPGETDLATMLADLRVLHRPGTYVFVTVGHGRGAAATKAPGHEPDGDSAGGGPDSAGGARGGDDAIGAPDNDDAGDGPETPAAADNGHALRLGDGIEALIAEAEGVTAIATIERARAEGWAFDFEAAWLTLEVHSALEAVGLTAAVSAALTAEGIACNVVAGFHHDHLLVPADRAADAIACLEALRS